MGEIAEKNPRKIFVDFCNNIRSSALNGKTMLKGVTKDNKENRIDNASDEFGKIVGMCEVLLTILNGG